MIDQLLQTQLRAKYNPEGSPLRKMQLRMLDMLRSIDKICRDNNIKYWLSSGTCLGALRHGGFIPWDDDVDIEMLEEDYKKFCMVMQKYPKSDLVLQTLDNDLGYNLSFGKIRDVFSVVKETHNLDRFYKYRGCFIDIFSLIPSNSFILSTIGHYLKLEELRLKFKKEERGGWYCALYSINKNINRIILPLIKRSISLMSNGNLRHDFGNGFLSLRNIKDILPLQYINFEGYSFPIPGNAQAYLNKIYGRDYESLPDLTKIEVHMNEYIFLDKNVSV